MQKMADDSETIRESFDNVYLNLSKDSGKCRFAESGVGWKPSGGGDTFTLDGSNIGGAQWSRAAKGYEVKILLRNSGVVQLDGFAQEVRFPHSFLIRPLTRVGFRTIKQSLQELLQHEPRSKGAFPSWMELGKGGVWQG